MRLFKRQPETEELEGPFFRTVETDYYIDYYYFGSVRYDLDSLVSVKPKRRDPNSYVVATRHEGESFATGGVWRKQKVKIEGVWLEKKAQIVVLRGKPIRKHPRDDRLELFQRVVVEQFLPIHRAFGDNGEVVVRFLDELDRRAERNTPQSEKISSDAWQLNEALIQGCDRDPNRRGLISGALDAVYAIAKIQGMRAACDAADAEAEQTAMYMADPSVSSRTAGICASRAALALVVQKHLAPQLFAELTEPFREAIDATMFGLQ